jgi:hypothetical protein
MRAGPLSDDKVIALLNAHFVNVFVSNEEYEGDGPAPKEERELRNRVWREALHKKLPSGTVHAYLLSPAGGSVFDSMHVADAARTERFLPMLKKAIDRYGVPAGRPVVAPAAQSRPPKANEGELVLHLTSRGFNQGSWREFPGENWIVLPRDAWQKFLPPDGSKPGASSVVAPTVSEQILTHFYPQTENNDVQSNRFEAQELTAKVLPGKEGDGGVVRVRLDGRLRMKHAFYPGRKDDTRVDAIVAGLLEFDRVTGRVRKLQIATVEAKYGKEGFGVAVTSE